MQHPSVDTTCCVWWRGFFCTYRALTDHRLFTVVVTLNYKVKTHAKKGSQYKIETRRGNVVWWWRWPLTADLWMDPLLDVWLVCCGRLIICRLYSEKVELDTKPKQTGQLFFFFLGFVSHICNPSASNLTSPQTCLSVAIMLVFFLALGS